MINLKINGKNKEIAKDSTISKILRSLKLSPETIIVELNKKIIEKTDFPSTKLSNNDTIEILRFMGGG